MMSSIEEIKYRERNLELNQILVKTLDQSTFKYFDEESVEY